MSDDDDDDEYYRGHHITSSGRVIDEDDLDDLDDEILEQYGLGHLSRQVKPSPHHIIPMYGYPHRVDDDIDNDNDNDEESPLVAQASAASKSRGRSKGGSGGMQLKTRILVAVLFSLVGFVTMLWAIVFLPSTSRVSSRSTPLTYEFAHLQLDENGQSRTPEQVATAIADYRKRRETEHEAAWAALYASRVPSPADQIINFKDAPLDHENWLARVTDGLKIDSGLMQQPVDATRTSSSSSSSDDESVTEFEKAMKLVRQGRGAPLGWNDVPGGLDMRP